jgi:hypothetical protein
MLADIDHKIAQRPGLDPVSLAFPGGGPVQRFRQAGIKFTVEPAEKIR